MGVHVPRPSTPARIAPPPAPLRQSWFDDRVECRNALSKLSYLNGIKELDRGALPWTRYPEERDVLIIEVRATADGSQAVACRASTAGTACCHVHARRRCLVGALGCRQQRRPACRAGLLPACAPMASLPVVVPACPAPICLLLLQGVVDTPVVPDY